jgi:Na+/proline symporter
VVFPDLESIAARFPNISPDILNDDLAFSAMLSYLPAGLLGLVIAALIAAYMSTISTQLNWGASYIVHDFYHRYMAPQASEKRLVSAGRIVTVVLMIFGAILALYLESALGAFNILIKIGAGTGLIFILRWFWWRINAYSEIAAMAISFPVAIYFELFYTGPLESHETLILSVLITTIGWVAVTLLTRPENHATLVAFVKRIRPHGSGWRKVMGEETPAPGVSITFELLNMLLGCIMVYSLLFSLGFFIYGQSAYGVIFVITAAGCGLWLKRNWGRLEFG